MGKQTLKTVNIDLPEWMISDLDREADRLGINRKALINVLLASVLQGLRKKESSTDVGYLKAAEQNFAIEWEGREDEENFRDL